MTAHLTDRTGLVMLAVLMALAGAAASIAWAGPPAPATRPAATQPSPALSPQEVVRAQLEAMQHNDAPSPDAGIATAFGFASPGNRAQTGPLERFIPMVKTPGYAPLLNFKSAEYAPVKVRGDVAQQAVKITAADGSVYLYVFILGKQADGPYKGCWMTDGVVPVRPQDQPPPDDGGGPVKT